MPVPTPTQAQRAPLRAVGSGLLWVWRPLESPTLTQKEGLGQGVCSVVLRFQDPGRDGRGGACDPTQGGRAAMATQSWVTACVSCQEHSSSCPYNEGLPFPDNSPCLQPTLPEPASSQRRGRRAVLVPLGRPRLGRQGAPGAEPPGLACPPLPRGAHSLLTGRSPFADAAAGPPLLEDPSPHGSQGPQAWWALPLGSPGSRQKGRVPVPGGR